MKLDYIASVGTGTRSDVDNRLISFFVVFHLSKLNVAGLYPDKT